MAVEMGLLASDVLFTLERPTMEAVIPETVPVNTGLATGAFVLRAFWVAVDTGLLTSEILSTLDRPTMVLVMPPTVPVKVGFAMGALISNAD